VIFNQHNIIIVVVPPWHSPYGPLRRRPLRGPWRSQISTQRIQRIASASSWTWFALTLRGWPGDLLQLAAFIIHMYPPSGAEHRVLLPAGLPRSGKLPVLNLLTGQKSGFSPRRGDSLHRFTSNFAGPTGTRVRLAMQNFTSIATGVGMRPPKCKIFHFLP